MIKNLKLLLPVKDVFITQIFGLNYLDFYSKLGLKGHNGIDFMAYDGCEVYASHKGVVTWAGEDGDGGISVTLTREIKGNGFKTIYYHLKETKVNIGDDVKTGQLIGLADNTGKYTTGSHLHFGLKFFKDGVVENYDNGYRGAVDPAPYFANTHGDMWYKPFAYHRYGRKQDWLAEFKMRFKNYWLHRQLNKYGKLNNIYDTIFINKLVYGGWSFDEAINISLNEIADHCKKDDFINGYKPFH